MERRDAAGLGADEGSADVALRGFGDGEGHGSCWFEVFSFQEEGLRECEGTMTRGRDGVARLLGFCRGIRLISLSVADCFLIVGFQIADFGLEVADLAFELRVIAAGWRCRRS